MSAARQLETKSPYDYPTLLNEKKKAKAPRQNKASGLLPAIAALTILVLLFSALIFVVYRYATLSETKYAIFDLKKEIKELSMQKEELEYELDTSVALDNVEKISIEQLDMSYPNQGQMVYMNASMDYNLTVANIFNGESTSEEDAGFVNQIVALAVRFKR